MNSTSSKNNCHKLIENSSIENLKFKNNINITSTHFMSDIQSQIITDNTPIMNI